MTIISKEVAAHVLFYYGEGGYFPGSFVESLLVAFGRADTNNRFKLGQGFPDYYLAVSLAQDDLNGIEYLQKIFRGES